MKTLCTLFALFCLAFTFGQSPVSHKQKAFEASVKLKNAPSVKGFLYEVRDSSIVLKHSLKDTALKVLPVDQVELLKVRRPGNLIRGAAAGGTSGVALGIVAVNSIPGGLDILTIPVTTWAGLAFGMLGAGLGVAVGSISDRIPVRGDLSHFEKYKGSLQQYSLYRETNPSPPFIHRSYAGFRLGLNRAGSEMLSAELAADFPEMGRNGIYFSLFGAYRIWKFFALGLTYTADSYSLTQNFEDYSNELDAILLAPVFSIPFTPKFRLSFTPAVGYAGMTYWTGPDIIYNGEGFATLLDGTFTYQYAKRWSLDLQGGSFSSHLSYKEGGSRQIHIIHAALGVAYHFGGRTL